MKGKSEIIINGLKPTNLVEKSYPLLMMKQVPFSLGELKILDTYLSRINARNVESRTVSFSKAEYESLMGIDRMRPERLAKYVDSMMGKIVTLPEGNGWRKYVLFTSSRCYKREDNDEWWIDITCSPEAKKFFFNIEGIGYLKYQLKNTLSLKSVNSLLLYWYLRANVFRGTYLKEHRKALYQSLLLKGTLNEHLAETDKTARQRLAQMLPPMLEKAGVTEQLKAQNQMEWVGLTNSVKQAAEEIIQAELIYN